MGQRAMFSALLLALSLATTAWAQALYSPPEGDFSVAFAATPLAKVQPAKRSKDVTYRRYVDQEPDRALVVTVDEYPDGVLPQLVDAGVYDHVLRDRAENTGMELVSTRAARLAGRPCLEGTFKDANDTVEVVRVLMLGGRIYQLTYARAAQADQPAAAAAFFNSFKLNATP